MKTSIRTKLILYFIFIIFITSIPIGIIAYKNTFNIIKENMYKSSKKEMIQVNNILVTSLKDIKENNKYIGSDETIKKSDESILALFNMSKDSNAKKYSKEIKGVEGDIYNQLERYSQTHPDVAYVYLGTKWGGYIQWPDGLNISDFDPRKREWYEQAMKNPDKVNISNPYMSSDGTKAAIVSTTSCVKNNLGEIIGVVGLDISLKKISEVIKNIKIGNSGYLFVYSKDGTIIAHPNSELPFKNLNKLSIEGVKDEKNDKTIKYEIKDYAKFINEENSSFETTIDGAKCLVSIHTSPDTGWKMASIINEKELTEQANKEGFTIVSVIILIILITIAIAYFVTRSITNPLLKIKQFAQRLESFDFSTPIKLERKDEFGQTSMALNTAQSNVKRLITSIMNESQEVSAYSEELTAIVEEVLAKFEIINDSTKKINTGVLEINTTAESMLASVQEVESNVGILSEKAADGSDNATKIRDRAKSVKEKSELAIVEIQNIYSERERKILMAIDKGKIVDSIKDMADTIASIAEQTNLLALNAAIEAARAGDHGKGFAVVAEEVRKLSEQSSQSVSNVKDTIDKVQDAFKNLSDNSYDLLRFMDKNVIKQFEYFNDIGNQYNNDADFVSSMSEKIALMTEDINATINTVNVAVQNMNKMTGISSEKSNDIKNGISESSQAVEQVAVAAENQSELAQKLNEMIQKFKI